MSIAVVKHIQRETKTRITFDNDDANDCRYAVIRGSSDTVREAERFITDIVQNQPPLFTSEIAIPYASVGTIIGRGGEGTSTPPDGSPDGLIVVLLCLVVRCPLAVIRAMQEESGAKINVARLPHCPPDNLNPVTIKGSPEQILAAKTMIDERIAGSEIRLHNLSTKGGSYKGRPMAIEPRRVDGDMRDMLEQNWSEPEVEEVIATADNGLVEVYVAAVESPDKFWLQNLGQKGTRLDRLCDDMTSWYEQDTNRTRNSLVSLPVKVGDIVAAPYHADEHYYRVRIVSIDDDNYAPEETPVRVFYLDFGDEGTHRKKHLYNLRDDFLHAMPFQAVECRLHAVKPATGTLWSDDAIK